MRSDRHGLQDHIAKADLKEYVMICNVCGKECHEWDMKSLSTGRKTVYICIDCYRHGSNDAKAREIIRTKKISYKRNNRKEKDQF